MKICKLAIREFKQWQQSLELLKGMWLWKKKRIREKRENIRIYKDSVNDKNVNKNINTFYWSVSNLAYVVLYFYLLNLIIVWNKDNWEQPQLTSAYLFTYNGYIYK